jgi:hypothetical protein
LSAGTPPRQGTQVLLANSDMRILRLAISE